MSADNAICVKTVGNNKWRMRMVFMSEDLDEQMKDGGSLFNSREEALIQAHDDVMKCAVLEYGVIEI